MSVTELATFSLRAGTNLNDKHSDAGRLWKYILELVSRQDHFEGLFYGPEVERPDVVQQFVNWDSVESHHKFMASPEYGPMVERLKQILVRDPQFLHYEVLSAAKLTAALSAPVTELATFYLPSRSESWDADVEKFIEVVKSDRGFKGAVKGWSIEDVEHEGFEPGQKGKAFLLAIGWQSVDAHMAFRETDAFKNNISLLRGEPKGVEVHHVAATQYREG